MISTLFLRIYSGHKCPKPFPIHRPLPLTSEWLFTSLSPPLPPPYDCVGLLPSSFSRPSRFTAAESSDSPLSRTGTVLSLSPPYKQSSSESKFPIIFGSRVLIRHVLVANEEDCCDVEV
ncbi:hypothetical protein Acr_22g0002630 [Actinidia rufa]|uniref:Uncharacterized protein n=1 Tax=Actinidia rufa TaxID=165716 RepID=A0A7J0GJB8_9ERIC|nr:hypothetical protein Acr_22g0002630 [Actinidia rufa]